MTRWRTTLVTLALAVACALPITGAQARPQAPPGPDVTVLSSKALGGLGSGSTIGPDGALYVTHSLGGKLLRIDPDTGAATVVGRGLPTQIPGFGVGGPMDVSFIGDVAYVLVSVAGADAGGPDDLMGIYRLRKNGAFSVFADLGTWSRNHPPSDPDWFVGQGVQYSMDVWRGGFLVTDAHLGRVIRVNRNGRISELVGFGSTDAVPLGLEVVGDRIFLTLAGPIPHLPITAKIREVRPDGTSKVVARWGAGYRGNRGLILDAEQDGGPMYGLLQGYWNLEPTPANEGFPAKHRTGEIVVVRADGTFRTVVRKLDQPTSMELVGDVAYVVTYTGTILRIEGF
ncbi:hypothetical protein J2X46_002071 [Nocardioides sp. BE266]|uniref:hypothetical protein n=1 Tax=Nocardioides sp. BE266 TaxID=2817725 RepID=UPI002861B9A8|nr:hypothetical protein [Nocardioides sp. BE266]MDR7253086.1 hypothetical protein [Nocardioides sp. BE266]